MIPMTNTAARRARAPRPIFASAMLAAFLVPAARAATEQELEAKLDALSAQLSQLQSELSALKAQRPQTAGAPAAPAVAAAHAESSPKLDWFGYGELNYARPRDDASRT